MPGREGPGEMIGATQSVRQEDIDENDICTSQVERHNLSVRTFLRRFTRLSLGFSKKLANLEAAVAPLYMVHFNFCRAHGSLPGTPAMGRRIAGHPWDMEKLFKECESE